MPDQSKVSVAYLRGQLKEFRQDDEARWKYDAEVAQKQHQLWDKAGRSDDTVKAHLKRAGVLVDVLEEDSRKRAAEAAAIHKELLRVPPPPTQSNRRERVLLDTVAALAQSHSWIYPPAYEGWGNSEGCGFNLALGEFNIELHDTGSGGAWGWGAFGTLVQYCTLWFYYFPPQAGDLTVSPHVDSQGNIAVSAHDHWYTSAHARLRLQVHFDLFQHYWDGEEVVTVVDEHRTDSSTAYWLDRHQILTKSLSVSANNIVWIKLTTALWGFGRSDHARVDCDFRTGAERRIRVEHINVRLIT